MIRPNSRILVIGAKYDFSEITNIRTYFDLIVSEDISFNETLSDAPDICFWSVGSPYLSGILEFPFTSESLMMTNFLALQKMKNLSQPVQTYNLAYLAEGNISSLPSVTRGVAIGLDPLMSGNHLARICGAVEIYDTENRIGTLPGKPSDLLVKIKELGKYGNSLFAKGPRLSLLDRI